MSSFLFYSSPPPAPYQPSTSFLTPQATRSNLFATSYSQWSSYQPKSPSPLRSSPNTGNYMRSQAQNELSSKYGQGRDGDNENRNATSTKDYDGNTSLTGSLEAELPSNTAPVFKFDAQQPQVPSRNPFAFQQRAREAAAASQVASRISRNRETRKAGFVDRLRRSRRDERDARGLDSFEMAEYWRERRERDARLRREAAGYDIHVDEDADLIGLEDYDEAELSPVDDDREVDELVEAYYGQQQGNTENDELMSDDFGQDEDEDYTEAFLEVLSQEQDGTDQRTQRGVGDGGLIFPDALLVKGDDNLDGDMDVS